MEHYSDCHSVDSTDKLTVARSDYSTVALSVAWTGQTMDASKDDSSAPMMVDSMDRSMVLL